MTRQVSWADFLQSTINAQSIVRGTSINPAEENSVYFILSISGANTTNPATIKDATGTTTIIVIDSERDLKHPIRIDDGFEITAGSAVTVQYSQVSKGN